MKKKIIARGLMFSMFLLLTMCITITNVSQPTSATTGETINITIDANLLGEIGDSQNLVFGFLAPAAWDVAGTGVATYTTSVGNGTMSLVPLDEIAPNSDLGLTWADDMKNQLGIGENYGLVKWVVYKSEQQLSVASDETITGQVQFSVTVGSDNIKTQLGYALANTAYGVDTADGWHDVFFTDCMEVTGGTNALINLCGPIPNSITYSPEVFTFGDILSIRFDATRGPGGNPTVLLDVDQVYLCASAIIDGDVVDVCQINDLTKFRNIGDNLWEITIWPQQFFNSQPSQDITNISFNITNVSGDIEVKDPGTGVDFQVIENCN